MNTSYTYHTTSTQETLEPHAYVDKYSCPLVKDIIHRYKFDQDTDALHILIQKTLDICIDRYMHSHTSTRTVHIYTTPPSTMYARKEKSVDSMFTLLQQSIKKLDQYILPTSSICVHSIYSIYHKYLVNKKAQHIGGTRSIRTRELSKRYFISYIHKATLWYYVYIKKYTHLSYTIIDDVSSTGATLVACKQTLLSYLEFVQKKNPHISYDVQIISLCH
jgi:hypothetical protein